MDEINFNNPHQPERKTIWAKQTEFDGEGKEIKFLNFETLKHGEGNPIANYVNPKGYTYRVTFEDSIGVRYLENRYDSFREDIRKCSPIKKGEVGTLRRSKDKYYHWVWVRKSTN